jgi:hypothetical protein
MKIKHCLQVSFMVGLLTFVACQKEETKEETKPTTTTGGVTDAKELARQDFVSMYAGSDVASFTWNGNTTNCNAGTLPQEVLDKAMLRIKYFRKAAGLSNDAISMNAVYNAKSQQAALMMKANNSLSHVPPTTWSCYTADGAEAAQKGNIAFGVSDVENINLWVEDEGSNNKEVGHRRWILYSRATQFGFGSTSNTATLWVINSGVGSSALPAGTPEYVAWPPKGFVPRDVVYPRWSLSIPAPTYPYQVDFTQATVVMKDPAGAEVPLTIEYANPIQQTYAGDNTLTWRPSGIQTSLDTDQKYSVKVSNVLVGGSPKTYEYDVTIFKP